MIIQSISAKNILKYCNLKLTNLPEKGIIAIRGSNESGKSTIGETVCFALFGRTFSIKEDEIEKLIRWGESHCAVKLNVRMHDGISYQISRSLDKEHNHSARLCRADDIEHPIARGCEAVAVALQNLFGYNFEAFIESFYLAQREITTPHPHGHAIHVMAGIIPLMICHQELKDDILKDTNTLKDIATRYTDLKTELSDLAFDGQRANILKIDQDDLNNREQDIQNYKKTLHAAAEDYQKRVAQKQQNFAKQLTTIKFRILGLFLAMIGLSGWWALTMDSPSPTLMPILTTIKHFINPLWFAYCGLTGLGIFILAWMRIILLSGRKKALHISGTKLLEAISNIDALELGLPKTLRIAANANATSPYVSRLEPEIRVQLRYKLPQGRVSAKDTHNAVTKENEWLNQLQNRINKHRGDLHQAMQQEQERLQTYDKLSSMETILRKEELNLQYSVQLRTQAIELLTGAMRYLSHRFNHHLRGLAGRTLPMFTNNRYQHLQIDDDLTVRAFSNEKRDFMELDEVSSGTQRQMMLALRLSLSQQLIDRVVRGKQFLFLDEPFAFFDEERTRSTLTALPRLSDDIIQIWIVAQQFPADFVFARSIECQRDFENINSNA